MARSSLTAVVGSFVTGRQATPKRSRSVRMEDSLTASARVDPIGSAARSAAAAVGRASSAWQKQSWSYYESVGELWYAANFVGACLSRCKLTIGLPDKNGNIGPCFDEDGDPIQGDDGKPLPGLERADEALDFIRVLKSDVGGQSQLLRSMGVNLAVAGEFHLVGSVASGLGAQTVDQVEQWEVLSTEEFYAANGEDGYLRKASPSGTPEHVAADAVHVVRIWKTHPRFSELPDASVRAVLDILEELVLLTREVRGEALSRLSNGKVLLVPQEIEWPDDEGDEGEGGDSFTRDLINTMSQAISDKASAAQTVPFIIRAPAQWLHPDALRTVDLARSNPSDSAAKRAEAVQRFAQGIDLPVEIVTGHAGTTFANAVVIDDSLFKSHIEPVLEVIADGLTAGYLKPALGGDSPLVVYYDSSELVSRPNRAQDAKDAHDRFVISDATLRASTGFSDSDAPDEEELAKRIEIKQLTSVRRTIPETPGQLQSEDTSLNQPGTTAPGEDVKQGTETAASQDGSLSASAVRFGAELAVARALQRAGARLRSQANKDPQLRASLAQAPDVDVAVSMGRAWVERVGTQPDFSADFGALHALVLSRTGDRAYADQMRTACEEIAAERLYDPRAPFPFDRLPVRGA